MPGLEARYVAHENKDGSISVHNDSCLQKPGGHPHAEGYNLSALDLLKSAQGKRNCKDSENLNSGLPKAFTQGKLEGQGDQGHVNFGDHPVEGIDSNIRQQREKNSDGMQTPVSVEKKNDSPVNIRPKEAASEHKPVQKAFETVNNGTY